MGELDDIATDPFLSEKAKEFWCSVERRVQEEYGANSLPEYIRSELKNHNITDIASKLNVDYCSFYRFLHQIGIAPIMRIRTHDKRIALEERIKQEYGIPLSEYTYRRYHHDMCNVRDLADEYGVSRQTILNWMRDWGISTRKPSETVFGMLNGVSPRKGKTYEEIYGAKRAKEIKATLSKRKQSKRRSKV